MGPFLIRHITGELDQALSGGIVSKVHQPDERTILLRIFVRGREEPLVISAHHGLNRVHLTKERFDNPPVPKRFCAYLRSRISGARIESVSQVDDERIVRIHLRKGYDGGAEDFFLIAELTGKSSNIILVDRDGVVQDALRYFEPVAALRPVFPGIALSPLPGAPAVEKEEAGIEKEAGITWNEAADRHYSFLVKVEWAEREKALLKKAINDAGKKAKRKLENLHGDREKADGEIDCYRAGELLSANFRLIKKGMKEVEAVDYAQVPPSTVRIRLDERLSPRENVERYFKRAKKAKKALELLKDRIPRVEEEIEYLENLRFQWEEAEGRDEIEALRDELIEGGYLREMEEKYGRIKEKVEKGEPVRRYVSSEGFEILCGKSGAGNDLLVKKYASQEDLWFHIAHMPGSHVLIKVAGRQKELTKTAIEEAASLAAWHSKARNAGKVEVIYTEAKNVKKPKGAKPGLVTVKERKSIVVRPADLAGKEEG